MLGLNRDLNKNDLGHFTNNLKPADSSTKLKGDVKSFDLPNAHYKQMTHPTHQ